MAYATLEDFFGDIVGKARRGQGLSEADLARTVGLTADELGRIESYEWTPEDDRILALAKALNLNGANLVKVARGWMPANPNDPFEDSSLAVERLIVDAGGMQANCYVFKCKATGEGAVVDPGAEAGCILGLVEKMQVHVSHVLLTHCHGDHVGALREVIEATGAKGVCGEQDVSMLRGGSHLIAETVGEGWASQVGALKVEAVHLPGHTPGGIGYGVGGVFFSGDTLFAGSLGGARGAAYTGQIEAVRNRVFFRNGEVGIFPGHGPVTTVEEERVNNPFFV